MGDISQLQDGVSSSENAVPETYYETLYPSLKEDEEYANIIPLTDKNADVSQKENDQASASPNARFDDGNLWRLKILLIVLMIMIIISTAIISAFIHVLMQRANATDYQLVHVQRPTQLEQVRIEDQFLVQAINTSIIQFKLDQRYDRVMIQTLNSSLQNKAQDLNTRVLFLDAQVAEINATYKDQEAKISDLELNFNDANNSLKTLDIRLETIEEQVERIRQLELGRSKDQLLIQSMNTSIMQLDSNQQYDRAIIQMLNSSELNCSCGNWAPFSACSVSCGHGIQFRKRKCENISVSFSRMWCSRYEIDIQQCTVNCQASDCQDILHLGLPTSGVYIIRPRGTEKKSFVYCDIDSEGEAWTVIQKRYDGSVDFYRNWAAYKEGFGDPHGEYWIGNEVIHKLSTGGNYTLKIILTDWNDTTKFASYNKFYVSGENDEYRLTISGYSGDAGHGMIHANDDKFSTFDNDNDGYSSINCAEKYHGAWWYANDDSCFHYAHLNGRSYHGPTVPSAWQGIIWYNWHGYSYSLKGTQMMIRKI